MAGSCRPGIPLIVLCLGPGTGREDREELSAFSLQHSDSLSHCARERDDFCRPACPGVRFSALCHWATQDRGSLRARREYGLRSAGVSGRGTRGSTQAPSSVDGRTALRLCCERANLQAEHRLKSSRINATRPIIPPAKSARRHHARTRPYSARTKRVGRADWASSAPMGTQ